MQLWKQWNLVVIHGQLVFVRCRLRHVVVFIADRILLVGAIVFFPRGTGVLLGGDQCNGLVERRAVELGTGC